MPLLEFFPDLLDILLFMLAFFSSLVSSVEMEYTTSEIPITVSLFILLMTQCPRMQLDFITDP